MNLQEAENLARALMQQHSLVGWVFIWDRAKRRFGYCSYSKRTISLSKILTELNPESEVRDTILHEIAHAKVGAGVHHGKAWREVAEALGAKPERCHSAIQEPKTWKGICPSCGIEVFRYRRRFRVACLECCNSYNKGRFDPQFLFKWARA